MPGMRRQARDNKRHDKTKGRGGIASVPKEIPFSKTPLTCVATYGQLAGWLQAGILPLRVCDILIDPWRQISDDSQKHEHITRMHFEMDNGILAG
jgi:hypothetical protein